MKKVMVGVMVGALGMFAWQRLTQPAPAAEVEASESAESVDYTEPGYDVEPSAERPASRKERFNCDGRKYCSEMTSCEEAKYFLEHCPDVKMDGEGDGVPCEKQWCKWG